MLDAMLYFHGLVVIVYSLLSIVVLSCLLDIFCLESHDFICNLKFCLFCSIDSM